MALELVSALLGAALLGFELVAGMRQALQGGGGRRLGLAQGRQRMGRDRLRAWRPVCSSVRVGDGR